MSSKKYTVVAAAAGLCAAWLLTHGALTVAHPERAALTGARAAAHAELERLESAVPAGRDDSRWSAYLRIVEAELAAGHLDVAARAWHDAYGTALESRSWESMVAVGDAYLQMGRATGTPIGARMNAREAYLIALIRARRSGSVDGALRCAEAFEGLGDRVIVEQSLYIASQLAAGDEQAQQRVHEARLRWSEPHSVAGS